MLLIADLPGPPEHPLRQLRDVRRDFLGYLRAASAHGDLVRLRPAPGVNIILVNHPALLREVLVTRAAEFHKTRMTRRMVGKFLGDGLVLSEGESHHRQRKLLQPLFSPRRVAACAPMLYQQAREFFAARAGRSFDLETAMTELALLGVLQVLFGPQARASSQVGAAMRVFADSMAQRFRSLPLPDWLPTRRNRADRAAIGALDVAIAALLAARRGSDGGDDVVGTLLEEQRRGGVSDREIRDQIATLYFAGHETTARLLTWSAILLSGDAAVGEALRAEAATLPAQAAFEDLERLPLLDQVIAETLRLYPPAWVFDREPAQDLVLGGTRLPAGTTLYLSPWVMHRDARHFVEPDRFRPARFAVADEAARHAYLPFGAGPRHCIGRALALLQGKACLAALARAGRITLDARDPPPPKPGATLGLLRPLRAALA